MTASPTHPATLGLFGKLPPELRAQIYHYHLVLPDSIRMSPRKTPSSFTSHIAECRTKWHFEAHHGDSLECVDLFSGERQQISYASRLALLATNRKIYDEAVHIFYRKNHLIFDSIARLQQFITSCQSRYRFMGEISFRYCLTLWSSDVFRALRECQNLRIMRIDFHHQWISCVDQTPLVSATGMRSLRKLRGIKTLELSGKDIIDIGGEDFQEIEVDDPRALGPILRRELTNPRK